MSRETKPMQVRVNLTCDEGHVRTIRVECPCTPTPPTDGEADAWIIAGAQEDTWNQLVRECQPHLDGRMHPERFAEMVMAYGASCARAALRARPLPADVQAVVERVRDAATRYSVDPMFVAGAQAACDALLAHLTREAP